MQKAQSSQTQENKPSSAHFDCLIKALAHAIALQMLEKAKPQ